MPIAATRAELLSEYNLSESSDVKLLPTTDIPEHPGSLYACTPDNANVWMITFSVRHKPI